MLIRTQSEIREELEKTQRDLDAVKIQLQSAKCRAASTGDYSDRDWFNRATNARHALGRRITQLQAELGIACRAERKRLSNDFSQRFISNAYKLLPPELYRTVFETTLSECHDADTTAADKAA